MAELDIQQFIVNALNRMSVVQQMKLLEFINAMLNAAKVEKPKGILQFAGIFDANDTQEFLDSMKDCEQIDENEW